MFYINKQNKIIIKIMRSFIFLLTLIALISSIVENPKPNLFPNLRTDNEDIYGCVVPEREFQCCWVHINNCCAPNQNHNDHCSHDFGRAVCCKHKLSSRNGKNTYNYPRAKKFNGKF